MKGDFSRLTGLKAKRKHFNGVLKQQGRVQLDSDWNELISVISHQRKTRTIDTIGHCGAPIHNSGYQILHPQNGMQDLLIASGRFYAGGLLCETTPSSKLLINTISAAGVMSVDDLKIDGEKLETGQWVQVQTDENPQGIIGKLTVVANGQIEMDTDISSLSGDLHPFLRSLILFSDQTDFPLPVNYIPVLGQTDLLYLDAWERHITAVEDSELREVALGGLDTDTRSKIITQVKVLPNVGDVQCKDEINNWHDLIQPLDGRLTTRLVDPADPADPCQLGESGGFLGLENHLYRVEIHDVDAAGQAIFKWSHNNAAPAYPIKEFIAVGGAFLQIKLQQNGKDDILKIKQQDWIEVSGEETDLNTEQAGTLVQVLKIDGDILTLDTDVVAHKDERSPKIRRWEISNQRPNVTTDIVAGTGFQLEDGIEIEFSGTEFQVGDYWVFSARTLTSEIEILDKEPALGIKHHYCKLALVTGIAGGNVEIEDCRPEFPPLTELPSGDRGCCTVTVGEGEDFHDIQLAIDSLDGGPGEVCIKPGVYITRRPILIKGDDITIKGCEGTPIIINANIENSNIVFQIEDSRDIHIHDLWCISIDGARVINVENSLFINIHDCMLIALGNSDTAGVIAYHGLTVNTHVDNNIIMGMVGIRYNQEDTGKQQLNLHLNARLSENIMFVLESALYQDDEALHLGMDVVDNLMIGFGLKLLSKAFFPESLYKIVGEAKIYSGAEMEAVKKARNDNGAIEGGIRNEESIHNLNAELKRFASEKRASAKSLMAMGEITIKPVIDLNGMIADANFTDNILVGHSGILMHTAIETTIKKNVIMAQIAGINCELIEGLTIADNFILAGKIAVKCTGLMALNLSIDNNRLAAEENGVQFMEGDERQFQIVWNVNINNNWIMAKKNGIYMNNSGIILQDFTAVDNSITKCEEVGILINALDENQFSQDTRSFQRVIQRNSISVSGAGISINVSDSKILDNEINIEHDVAQVFNNSRGIILLAGNAVIANNTIQSIVNSQEVMTSYGGIYLSNWEKTASNNMHEMVISHNHILGGKSNGIEIGSDIDGLIIEENQIEFMGLNGIAVQEHIGSVNNLSIIGNRIENCHQLAGSSEKWWIYAGIVLTTTERAQITNNRICNNGNSLGHQVTFISAFYADRIREISISNNQFINNEVPGIENRQAAIHIPISIDSTNTNSDVQINNNLIKSEFSPALIMGHYMCIRFGNFFICFGIDHKAVITGNQFESNIPGPIVELQVSRCIFSDNLINCNPKTSTSLGYGTHVMANGNVVSDSIQGAGFSQQIINTLEY